MENWGAEEMSWEGGLRAKPSGALRQEMEHEASLETHARAHASHPFLRHTAQEKVTQGPTILCFN